jgi:lipid-A-disaccharide synthase-like uncharacterized protein
MSIFGFEIDLWTIWGLMAQFVFFSSFVFQWYSSEKKKESHLPLGFWYLRMLGSLMLFVYVFERRDFVFFISIILQLLIYGRNVMLIKKKKPDHETPTDIPI